MTQAAVIYLLDIAPKLTKAQQYHIAGQLSSLLRNKDSKAVTLEDVQQLVDESKD